MSQGIMKRKTQTLLELRKNVIDKHLKNFESILQYSII